MHLQKPGCVYSAACAPFKKKMKESKNLKKQQIYDVFVITNEVKLAFNKTWIINKTFDFKNSTRRTASDKTQRDNAFDNAKNLKYDEYQRGIGSMVYEFFDKKSSGSSIKTEHISDQCLLDLATRELAEELHKLFIGKLKSKKVRTPFIENIWGDDLADIQLISKFNKGVLFLLFVANIFSKYAWVIPLKDKKRYYNY